MTSGRPEHDDASEDGRYGGPGGGDPYGADPYGVQGGDPYGVQGAQGRSGGAQGAGPYGEPYGEQQADTYGRSPYGAQYGQQAYGPQQFGSPYGAQYDELYGPAGQQENSYGAAVDALTDPLTDPLPGGTSGAPDVAAESSPWFRPHADPPAGPHADPRTGQQAGQHAGPQAGPQAGSRPGSFADALSDPLTDPLPSPGAGPSPYGAPGPGSGPAPGPGPEHHGQPQGYRPQPSSPSPAPPPQQQAGRAGGQASPHGVPGAASAPPRSEWDAEGRAAPRGVDAPGSAPVPAPRGATDSGTAAMPVLDPDPSAPSPSPGSGPGPTSASASASASTSDSEDVDRTMGLRQADEAATGGRAARRKAAAAKGRGRGSRQPAPTARQPATRLEARRAERARRAGPFVLLSRFIGEMFITLGVLMLLFVGYQLWWTNVLAHQQAGGAAQDLEDKWEQKPERKPGAFKPGQGFAIMYLPKLDVKVPVAEGVDKPSVLDKGMVGHYNEASGLETAMPWDKKGNFAVAGHRNTHGEPFRYVNKLVAGDEIIVETADTYYVYEMRNRLPSTSPSNTGVIGPVPPESGFEEPGRYITLTTCTPEFTSKYRLIVWGEMVEERPRSKGKPDALVG